MAAIPVKPDRADDIGTNIGIRRVAAIYEVAALSVEGRTEWAGSRSFTSALINRLLNLRRQ
jgi:hypothetical protein